VDKAWRQIVDVVGRPDACRHGGKNLKDIASVGGNELENGNVESTAAEIVDGNFAALFSCRP